MDCAPQSTPLDSARGCRKLAAMMLVNRFHRPGLRIETAGLALFLFSAFATAGQIPVLKQSDVVFMTRPIARRTRTTGPPPWPGAASPRHNRSNRRAD